MRKLHDWRFSHALTVPDIDSYVGTWRQAAAMLEKGEISKDDYEKWVLSLP